MLSTEQGTTLNHMLRLAIKARLARVRVVIDPTENPKYLATILRWYTYKNLNQRQANPQWAAALATGEDDDTANVTDVFVDECSFGEVLDVGAMTPPHELRRRVIRKHSKEPVFQDMFGGMSLQRIDDIMMMAATSTDGVTVTGVQKIIQAINPVAGLEKVAPPEKYYWANDQVETLASRLRLEAFKDLPQELRTRGVMLHGKSGTGKTTAAAYLGKELNLPVFRVELTDVLDQYTGNSEKHLKRLLAIIDSLAGGVVLFDEVEKVFNVTANSEVMPRLMSMLLWWLQTKGTNVFVIMTSNDLQAIPPELYRSGRLSQTLELENSPEYIAALSETYYAHMQTLYPDVGNVVPAPWCTTAANAIEYLKSQYAEQVLKV